MNMLPVVNIPMGTAMDVQDHPAHNKPRRQTGTRSLDPSRDLDMPSATTPSDNL